MKRFAALVLVLVFAATATLARPVAAPAMAMAPEQAAAGARGEAATIAYAGPSAPAATKAMNRCPYAGGGAPAGPLCAFDKATGYPDAVLALRSAQARYAPAGARRLTGRDAWRPKRPPKPLIA